MRKTLLLVFIHGFKGGDDTFRSFPEHFRALISHAFPKVDVVAVTYPKFETRGELKECVARFREWLQNKVIDLEVAHSTPNPTVDPSVHTILIGHSMGGIVAAETLLLIANEQPVPPTTKTNPAQHDTASNTNPNVDSTKSRSHPNSAESSKDSPPLLNHFMFPHIQGLLAFDTPLLGISATTIAYGAEGHYKTANTAYTAFSEISNVLGWGSKPSSSTQSGTSSPRVAGMLPPASNSGGDAAAAPRWQSWGKYAMFAGAAGVAAGGAAALYSQREKFNAGITWATSHLEFVGCLAKGEDLRRRVAKVTKVAKERGVGLANFYTILGSSAAKEKDEVRTFCAMPKGSIAEREKGPDGGYKWIGNLNDKAKDEVSAHMSMFSPKENPGFYGLNQKAKEIAAGWVDILWYEASEERADGGDGGFTHGELGDGWERPDYNTEGVREKERQKSVVRDWEDSDALEEVRFDNHDDSRDHSLAQKDGNHLAKVEEAEKIEVDIEDLEESDAAEEVSLDEDEEVKMRDEVFGGSSPKREHGQGDEQKEDLQSSVIVDKPGS